MNFTIRPATPSDIPDIHRLIQELALFEKAPEQVINTPERMLRDGFGEQPAFICFVMETDGRVQGMSLCYVRYSTWKGPCLYLEDLIVSEPYRGQGCGKALFRHTLAYAKDMGYQRLQWQVLDWNQPAIEFYTSFKASFDGQWLNSWIDLH